MSELLRKWELLKLPRCSSSLPPLIVPSQPLADLPSSGEFVRHQCSPAQGHHTTRHEALRYLPALLLSCHHVWSKRKQSEICPLSPFTCNEGGGIEAVGWEMKLAAWGRAGKPSVGEKKPNVCESCCSAGQLGQEFDLWL